MKKRQIIIDAIFFQAIWFVCVIGNDPFFAILITIANFLLHLVWLERPFQQLRPWFLFIGCGTLLGFLHDSLMIQLGLFDFPEQTQVPIWLSCLWLNYWITWHWSLNWMSLKPKLCSLIAGMGGTYAYGMGYYLDRVEFPFSTLLTLSVLCFSWSTITYGMLRLKPKMDTPNLKTAANA